MTEHGNPSELERLRRERKVFKAAIIDTTELVEGQARDIGDKKMTESREDRSQGFLKKIGTRIWKHTLFQEYYRQKEIGKARSQIKEGGNLYVGEDGGGAAQTKEAMSAIIDRFTSEYDMEMLKDEERSSKTVANPVVNAQIRELIKTYATNPDMDSDAFKEERTRVLSAIHPEYVNESKTYADNLLEIATEVRRAVEHGERIEEMDFDVQLTLGKAKETLNTEAQKNTFDRITEKLQNSKIGSVMMNAPALAGILAAGYSVAKFVGISALRSNVAKIATFGGTAVLAGGLAGAKESARLNRERAQHMRERAKGITFEEDAKRREEMESNRYETRPAKGYIDTLENGLTSIQAGTIENADVLNVIQTLAELEGRIKLGDKLQSDFIEYSRFDQVEQERTKLALLRAKIKVALRDNPEAQRLSGNDMPNYLLTLANRESIGLKNTEVLAKDRIFTKMKTGKVLKTALATMAIGAAVGVVGQEIGAEVTQALGGHTDGFFSGLFKSFSHKPGLPTQGLEKHSTALEGLRQYMTGDSPRLPFGKGHDFTIGDSHIKLPEGVEMHANPDGTYDITRNGEIIGNHEHIGFSKDGNFTPETKVTLGKAGIFADFTQIAGAAQQHHIVSPADYIKETGGVHTPKIHRELWYDNDTQKFDKNELKEWFGGEHNTGIDKDGNFIFNMRHMLPKGSYHADQSIDAPASIKSPGLKMLFSMSRDTQHQPFELEIRPDGTAVIPKDSEIAKVMFDNVNGHAVFKGQFAEVAQATGKAADGGENFRILATHVGQGLKSLDRVLPIPGPVLRLDVPDKWDFDMPPFIPILARQPLEDGKSTSEIIQPINMYYQYLSAEASEQVRTEYRQQQSETIRSNPDAKLDARKEILDYLNKENSEDKERIALLATQAGPMKPECKLSVCIPVAGHQEENNIERTLSNFLNQTADPKSFEIVLFINQPDKDREGNPIIPDQTAQKVEAFRVAHPEMQIRVMNMTLPSEDARIGYIRKLLNDTTIQRSAARSQDTDLILVSNDADTKGVAPEYIDNFVKRFDKNPNVDAMLGQLDWDPESYIRNPIIHVGTRLYQYLEIQARVGDGRIGSTGANTALRSSIYAAVGGYDANDSVAEDVSMTRKIHFAREGAIQHETPMTFARARVSRLYTSSRRAEKVFRDGFSPIEQWNQEFSAFDDEVRKTKWEDTGEAPNYNDPDTVDKIISSTEMIINRTLKSASGFINPSKFATYTRRSLEWLGIKYTVVGKNEIKITDASKLIEGLKAYQEEGMKIMARKTTKQKPHVRVRAGSRPSVT